jgi:nitroimidazol reductase NimA-like FMN-containing flavoprotein (pyridoxamine 5'-phosphate oxidase superfamily)
MTERIRRGRQAPSERTRVKRLGDRGAYDAETINAILDAGLLAHVGYVIDGAPYVTPTAHWREGDYVYWHGSSASRMLRSLEGGVAACIAVSHLDGLVLARSAFHHSVNYRSVMAFGLAEKVEDPAHKEAALRAFTDRIAPGRWDELRPVTAQELKATSVLRLKLDEASAKVRTGMPSDDEDDVGWPVWAGVLPLHCASGQAIADPHVPGGMAVPANILGFRHG